MKKQSVTTYYTPRSNRYGRNVTKINYLRLHSNFMTNRQRWRNVTRSLLSKFYLAIGYITSEHKMNWLKKNLFLCDNVKCVGFYFIF